MSLTAALWLQPVLLLILWGTDHVIVLLGVAIAAALAAWMTARWQFALIAVYSGMEAATQLLPSPYEGYASRETLWPILLTVTLLCLAWTLAALRPDQHDRASLAMRRTEVAFPTLRQLYPFLALMAIVGLAANGIRFRQGVPLFAENIDAAREVARQEANLVVGLLQEAWTLGLLVATAALFFSLGSRWICIAWMAFFAFGAFMGGSRNAILVGLLPAAIAWLSFKRSRGAAISVKSREAALVGLAMLGVLVGAYYYSGSRTLAGEGAFEREFAELYGESPWLAGLASFDLSLSAPFETWSRIFVQGEGAFGETQFVTLAWLGSVLDSLGFTPDMNAIAASVSYPFYMNAPTIAGPAFVDFGMPGIVLVGVVVGVVVGLAERTLLRQPALGQLIFYGYLVYHATLSLYSFVPYSRPSWIAVLIGLCVILPRTTSATRGVTAERKRNG